MRMSSTVNSCEAVGELMITRSHVTGTRLHHLHTYDSLLYFHWRPHITHQIRTSLFLRLSHTTIMFCRCIKYTEYCLASVVQIFPLLYYFSWKLSIFKFWTNYEKSDLNIIVLISVWDLRDQHFKYINVWLSSNMIFLLFWAY